MSCGFLSSLTISALCVVPLLLHRLLLCDVADVQVACGDMYSAAVSASGLLFTWGCGSYGRLGHGSRDDCSRPAVVEGLRGERVVKVSCGEGDAHTLALTDDGAVFVFGDADNGKVSLSWWV